MTDRFYPSELSQHLQAGFAMTPPGAPRDIQPERGRRLLRGGAASDPRMVSACQTIVEAWQLARFEKFWGEEVDRGALTFWLRDQAFYDLSLLDEDGEPILGEDGEPLTLSDQWLCRFIGKPSAPHRFTDVWTIQFALEVIL